MKNELLKFWLPNPGKFADIVGTDKNPLQDITTLESVSFVMKDGKVYKK